MAHKLKSRKLLAAGVVCCLLAWLIHKPLPLGFTDHPLDRLAMTLIEPGLRVAYYWPADKLCPNARCRLTWTRFVLNVLARLVDPRIMVDYHPNLHLKTEYFDGVEVRTYLPKSNRSTSGAIFFVHGGGFVLGNTAIYEGLMRRMALQFNGVVVSVEYRLAPETTFPGGLHDVETALAYFLRRAQKYKVDPSKVVLMGDSAGGNLIAATAQRFRNRPEFSIAGQVLLYPLLQFHNLQTGSFKHFWSELDGYAFVDPISVSYYYMWYAGIDVSVKPELALSALSNGHVSEKVRKASLKLLDFTSIPQNFTKSSQNATKHSDPQHNTEAMTEIESFLLNPDFAPLMQKNLTGLPPSLVVTCQFDILRDEGVLYAKRLQAAGVPTLWLHFDVGFHAMLNFHNELYLAQKALDDVLKWTSETVS